MCEKFLDEILDAEVLSVGTQDHVQICHDCRRLRGEMKALRRLETAYPFRHQGLKNRIMEKIPSSPPSSVCSENILEKWFSPLVWKAVCALILAGFCLWGAVRWRNQPVPMRPVGEAFIVRDEQLVSREVPAGTTIEIASGKTIVTGPDLSVLELSGPASMKILHRGFELNNGVLQADVVHTGEAFVGTTPDGKIEVIGTRFMVRVDLTGTRVEVQAGKVQVTPAAGPSKILIANQGTTIMDQTPAGVEKRRRIGIGDRPFDKR